MQGVDSNVCGHYCLYYLLNRCRGISMEDIVNTFNGSYGNNDQYVLNYIESIFPFCINPNILKYSDQKCCSEVYVNV